MTTTVVNLRREPFDVYIGRAGKGQDGYFGNPFTVKEHGAAAIDKYRRYFQNRVLTDPEFLRRVRGLFGKRLGCFCKPGPCHGDVIAEFVNNDGARFMAKTRTTVATRPLDSLRDPAEEE